MTSAQITAHSLLLVVVAVTISFWTVGADQFDDLDTAAVLPTLDANEDLELAHYEVR